MFACFSVGYLPESCSASLGPAKRISVLTPFPCIYSWSSHVNPLMKASHPLRTDEKTRAQTQLCQFLRATEPVWAEQGHELGPAWLLCLCACLHTLSSMVTLKWCFSCFLTQAGEANGAPLLPGHLLGVLAAAVTDGITGVERAASQSDRPGVRVSSAAQVTQAGSKEDDNYGDLPGTVRRFSDVKYSTCTGSGTENRPSAKSTDGWPRRGLNREGRGIPSNHG